MTTFLLACLASIALLSCEKIEPLEILQPKQEEDKKPEVNNRNNNGNPSNEMTTTLYLTIGGVTNKVMETSQHIRVVIYLLLSAAGCLAGGVIGFIRCRELETHMAELEKKA